MPGRIIRVPSSRGISRGVRRKTDWLGSADIVDVTTLPAASFVVTQSLTAVELAKRPFTIVRTVGSIWLASDQSGAVEFPFGAVGFIVVSEKASALGATAIPDPITQESSDEWFAYTAMAASGNSAAAGIVSQPLMEYKFDSRAMRKVQDGEDIVVVVANASATDGAAFILKFRMLIKLS